MLTNKLRVIGHVGMNPSVTKFQDTGNQVVKFSVAINEYSPNTDEKTTFWLDVDAWNGLGERILKTVTKGREVVLEGRLAFSTFDKTEDGVKIRVTKPLLKLSDFHPCGKKPKELGETQVEESEVESAD